MKSILFSACIAGCLVFPSAAFAEPDQGQFHGRRAEKIKQELGLTDEQSNQIRAIFKSSHEERQKQIASVLTPEQLKKFQDLKEKRREGWKAWRKNKGCSCDSGTEATKS